MAGLEGKMNHIGSYSNPTTFIQPTYRSLSVTRTKSKICKQSDSQAWASDFHMGYSVNWRWIIETRRRCHLCQREMSTIGI
ncbi:unnamed protein product [Ambrosiozyma monospora]|uniref:Unnamed protein product n=1 Tax=Ambrosiozyma monospora TaxID=43982 RepID=A0ACB5STH6_AMBMO|nr:unnamed protein product [Ambrosiozyma monospora]